MSGIKEGGIIVRSYHMIKELSLAEVERNKTIDTPIEISFDMGKGFDTSIVLNIDPSKLKNDK